MPIAPPGRAPLAVRFFTLIINAATEEVAALPEKPLSPDTRRV
jgi:hypothetical protein